MSNDDPTIAPLTSTPTMGVGAATVSTLSRFVPGAIIAGRYRLVALLGRGGMGEVYRAEDLTLDQPVALKFLPAGIGGSDARLAQFHQELRIARQVSHRHVCRLFDVGDADGRRFLTMEYVDGEDLGASLRRFGRMPPDKAIQIARQLCAAVAAAHDKGVLHRDLKPANVMLDGNGDARVMDFGIATAAADSGAALAGTPQYMAPELLEGKPASTKSDIYALGLILFEIFTGKRVYEADSIHELRQLHDTQFVPTPSSIVRDLDPAIERVVMRCLEKDPEKRPASALTIAAALPGADPLGAALAAGETPSPELLVAAGESEAMPVARALGLVAACVAMVFVAIVPLTRGSATSAAPTILARDVLDDRADQIAHRLGYSEPVADHAAGFMLDDEYLRWEEREGPNDWWNEVAGGPSPIRFWARASPQELTPRNEDNTRVQIGDPPEDVPGMRELVLDGEGRMLEFHSVPADVPAPADAAPPWAAMFQAADLDVNAFTAATPQLVPRDFADARMAWDGPMPGRPDRHVRVEAASFRNRLVSFQIVWPWTASGRHEEAPRSGLQKVTDAFASGLYIALLLGGVLLARHNLRLNRADRRGAARVGIALMLASLASHLVDASHPFNIVLIVGSLASAAFNGGFTWVLYLAIEPYARRFWPDALLAWARLTSGRLRDPRVGGELLIGLTFGALTLIVVEAVKPLSSALGWRMPQFPFGTSLSVLNGTSSLAAFWLGTLISALQGSLEVALILLAPRLVFKRSRVALAVGVVFLALLVNNGSLISGSWLDRFDVVAITVLITVVVHRFGLLAMAVMLFVDNIVSDIPLTIHLSAWWAAPTLLTIALLTALLLLAYIAARGGKPLLGDALA